MCCYIARIVMELDKIVDKLPNKSKNKFAMNLPKSAVFVLFLFCFVLFCFVYGEAFNAHFENICTHFASSKQCKFQNVKRKIAKIK